MGDALFAAPGEHDHAILGHLRVRDDHGLVGVGRERQVPPPDSDDLPGDAVDADPVADPAGVVELQRHAAPEVLERLAQRQCDAARDNRRRRDDAREIDADGVHPVETEHDEEQREQHVGQDPRDAEPL